MLFRSPGRHRRDRDGDALGSSGRARRVHPHHRAAAAHGDCKLGGARRRRREIAEVEVLIIDALRRKPHPTHLSVAQAVEVAARVQPKETYFTHIAHELPQSFEKNLPPHTHMAYDGLKLSF